ncbi:hypothetical protein BH10PSE9_BH10PSE9_07050 [soil metagenome]
MRRQTLIAVISVGLLTAAAGIAAAADMAGRPPIYVPPPVACGEPVALYAPVEGKHKHKQPDTDYVRIYTVLPYNPGCPSGLPVPLYVPPQTAYLTSSPTRYTECIWPCKDARHHDWYDGKLWYHNAGTPNRPDVFMILERD